ncbi:unnamed protein product [Albugo candida]|uniref:Translation initiation factor eIF2B subunit beta n=1 Tax=Albugo candida TaxID=65357 RepID=A0A024GF42_9STRA|nr:unnamed protein product [Albugo candida]|eukprot:CCI45160.1 unnamed protein product [Albugo candida]
MTPKWMEEQPKLKQCLLDIVLSFKRCQCDESNDTSLQILDFAEKMLTTIAWSTASDVIKKLREIGWYLSTSVPQEVPIANVVRRILFIIREEVLLATKSNTASCSDDAKSLLESKECIGRSQCSLETLLTPGSVTNLSLSTAELKMSIMEGIRELRDEIQNSQLNISDQAIEFIHTEYAMQTFDNSRAYGKLFFSEVILSFGMCSYLEAFFQAAAKKRQFKVIVVESAPSLNGHALAHQLALNGIDVTVIPDTAVFAIMARVNKVIIPAYAVLADGGLIAQSGLHNIVLAAKNFSIPVICITSLITLCPLYAHDVDTKNELGNPSQIFDHQDVTDKMAILNPTRDYVPPSLVDLYVTNIGAHQASHIYRLQAEYYSSDDHDLAK